MARIRRPGLLVPAAALALSGCGSPQDTLDPHSPQSGDIAALWWWMLAVAGAVFLGALAMLGLAWLRRSRRGLPFFGESERATTGLVVAFGMVIPATVLVALFGVADLYLIKRTSAPAAGSSAMTVDVVGHQWFWEVRYPGTRAVTANEIHIPARTPVRVVATTADVIHSFWVPELNRKVDTIPGQRNSVLLYADEPGTYRGQCAEFCGLQHAHMGLAVVAQPRARFRAWLERQARPVAPPSAARARRGRRVFMANACSDCHTIRGTPAQGKVGPDLTHVAGRSTLAALTIPNAPRELAAWIRDPQAVKPGNRMPGLRLSPRQVGELVAYLEHLR